jgi:C-terminal processing protease CtpA/Prc
MAAFSLALVLVGTMPQAKSSWRLQPAQVKASVASKQSIAVALAPLRHLAAGCALFVGIHSPAAHMIVPPAFAETAAIAVAAPSSPIAEAWDYADRYFLDRTFGDHDWKAIKAELVDKAPETLSDDEVDKRVKDMYRMLGDRYSRALSRVEADALSKYDVTGVNVNVMRRPSDGKLVVSAVPPKGSESDRAGVRYGDQVVSINGVSMQGKSPFDALEIIQSSTDNTVTMELQRDAQEPQARADSADGKFAVRLKRAFTASSPVLSRIVRVNDGGRELRVGYVKLSEFNSVGKRQVGEALTSMQQRGVDG